MLAWQIAASAASGAASLGLGAWVAQRLLHYRKTKTADEIASEIAMDRYRPMARLLDSEDLEFLASRPGYRREVGNRLRDARRRIFRMYLAELSADFGRLHAAARRMVAEAPEQCADLVPLLMRQRVAFWRSLAMIEVKLTLNRVAPADAGRLLEIIAQLQQAMAAATPAPASI